ncbi:MAG: NAD-dependent malic enzyme [Planctomycetes bacterium]|jgi:malate dehydrogenase (oxaloacetate-decarboxylating)(NADP+)|nr:NAD-dependent malic enzyme [Planctomycetota bacterium]
MAPRPVDYLHDPRLNKGTGFTTAERDALGLHGLLPPRVVTQAGQQARILENLRVKNCPIEKYIYLASLLDRNEHLFYRVLMDHIEEMMPIVYTPTVGEACTRFAHIFRRSRGLYVTAEDRGRIAQVLRNWPDRDIGIIVVTDGERILGLGDLGANGMGIPIGKLSLYTACAGVAPEQCLPITIDVGTSRPEIRDDPFYLGLPQERLRGAAYDALLEEFVMAVQEVFPRAILQFEDFATENAIRLLARYRDRACCFNDDIQGTAAVALAGLFSAIRITGVPLTQQRILFLGAGSAATGIADLFVSAMEREGISREAARRQCWFVDSHGLVVKSRTDLQDHKLPYAHEHAPARDLLTAVESLQPTAILGVSAQPQTFTEPVVRAMSRINARPIIFPLSNPTSKAECTAEDAYRWSGGNAVFASGSPFAPVEFDGRTLVPGQGNNAYIFPGLGLGAIVAGARRITDSMFYAAARTLAGLVEASALASGLLYPRLSTIREVSAHIAVAVAEIAYAEGLATAPRPEDLEATVRARMYDGTYPTYV